ncbi:SusC/RagA family TonB-linked outer membrane protein [Flavobacterium sp.]|uniref:SusC/RagA family TonB-linked outer membrane protein n=1 Tax=Flavobacterium sp. TaxID=239 RepID=UPI0032638540
MSAQDSKIIISGVVVDNKGNHIAGAIITGSNNQTSVANETGEFALTVDRSSPLIINAPGYKTTSVEAKSDLQTIILESSEMVQVAFNKVDKADVLGGVSSVNIANMLESNYTTFSLDNLSGYIPGYHGNIWGMNGKLILVDGVPRDEFNVLPSEIEEITVLKSSAALVLYGSRAAKGVVSIITKRGAEKKNRFDVRLNTGILTPKRYAEYLGSAESLGLYNEAIVNDNISIVNNPSYTSEAELANYASGVNPYRYPNIDFYSSDYLRKFSTRSEIVTEYTGGNEKAQFYVNVGNYNTSGLIDIGNGKKEGENRFNIRGNLDIKLNDMITSKINTSVTFYDGNSAQGNFWGNAATLKPNLFAPLIPLSYLEKADEKTQNYIATSPFIIDGKYLLGGTSTQQTNPFADIYTRGIIKGTYRKYQFDASLNFNLASVLKGLTFDTQFAIDYNTQYSQNIDNNTYAVYSPGTPNTNPPVPGWLTDGDGDYIPTLTKLGADLNNNSRSLDNAYQRQTKFFSGAFKYKFDYDRVHNFSTMLIAHGYTLAESEVYHAIGNANLGFQFNYNYKNTYYADFSQNMVHSARFAPKQRDAFSPTVSVGWRISNEKFLSESNFIDDLKLTASAGILNTDLDYDANTGYNLYKTSYSSNNGSFFSWQEGRQLRTTDVLRGENYALGFERRKEISLGLEASLFKNMIQVSASYFYTRFLGIPGQNVNAYPNFLSVNNPSPSSFIPYANFEGDQREGYDLGISFNKRVNKVDLNVGFVATYYDTKAYTRNDVLYADAYQRRAGKPIDALYGLKSDGFFSVADIAAMANKTPGAPVPQSFGAVKPGSIKYVDVNNDGVVDNNDQVYLGRGGYAGSPLTLGLNATAKWNNFSLFVMANRTSGSYGFKNNSYYWASGINAKYSAAMRDRWTEATAATATYPSLSTGNNGDNNFRNSDFWLYKNDRINLARVQLSYDIPKAVLSRTFISNLGFYVNGSDLLTISKEKQHMETNFGAAPQMRYYSLGLTAAF